METQDTQETPNEAKKPFERAARRAASAFLLGFAMACAGGWLLTIKSPSRAGSLHRVHGAGNQL